MKRILPCTKDAYITNRVIDNKFRATDANVGFAGTIDLFKLAGESRIGSNDGPYVSGTTDPIELTRALLKFDLDGLRALTGSILNINHPTFRCELQMFDVLGGQTLPSNFKLILYPLSQSFNEGIGRDVNAFEDIDAANFITASVSGDTAITWFQSGANQLGFNGQLAIDAITGSMALGDLFVIQEFAEGSEDLAMDITKVVSATMSGLIPDHGFRISFSGTQETDDRTRFVKRFATRHATNTRIRPRIVASWDDSTQDVHESFLFDVSGSLFLYNYHRGIPTNIQAPGGPLTGSNVMLVTLTSGSVSGTYVQVVTASQHTIGSNRVPGVYSASLSIPSDHTLLSSSAMNDLSATFTERWTSMDGSFTYLLRKLVVSTPNRVTFQRPLDELKVNITNIRSSFKSSERIKFRVFIQDDSFNFKYTRLPLISRSAIYDRMYWRMRDAMDETVVIPFDTDGSTRLSSDSEGMYFEFFMSDLDVGRLYEVDLLIEEGTSTRIFEGVGGRFRVES